jgi:hypothetical protein
VGFYTYLERENPKPFTHTTLINIWTLFLLLTSGKDYRVKILLNLNGVGLHSPSYAS